MPADAPVPPVLLPRRRLPQPLRIQRDWAQDAADAVLKDLLDRRGIKRELEACRHEDPAIWREIRGTLAGIIRDKAPRP